MSSGSACAENAVKPRKSQKTATTSALVPNLFYEFRHLGCEEALQPRHPLSAVPRYGEFLRHLIELLSQPLKFVSSCDVDPVIELSGTDLMGALLQ